MAAVINRVATAMLAGPDGMDRMLNEASLRLFGQDNEFPDGLGINLNPEMRLKPRGERTAAKPTVTFQAVSAVTNIRVEMQHSLEDIARALADAKIKEPDLASLIKQQQAESFRQACVLAVDSGHAVTLCEPWTGPHGEQVEICTIMPNLCVIWRHQR